MKDELRKFVQDLEQQRLAQAKLVVETIKNKQLKVKNKSEQIANLQYESELITNDIINDIKSGLFRSDYNLFNVISSDLFWQAWKYSGRKNKDWEDEKHKEECKKSYNFITNRIKEYILKNNKDYKLQSIVDCNYSAYYSFEYKYKNKVIRIDIPIYSTANTSNYKDLLRGYSIAIQTSPHCWEQIFCNMDYREVANFLENYNKEEQDNVK